MILKLHEQNPHLRAIRSAVEVLRNGGLIVYPTDTIYGLGCDLHNKRALEKLYRIKNMDEKSPLSFISPDLSNVSQYAQVGNRAYRIMNKCLPGPFTFILPAMKEVNRYMLYKRKQIGIRVPASNICRMLTLELGNPIINTSVPLWGEKVLNSGEVIDDQFGSQIDLVLDIGVLVSEPSTIVDLSGDEEYVITRQGKGEITL
jgi:tRNA threonylcarbamoyl adenosine modification protein (Sua5/YciO/YrdC/YwlC family)